MFEVHSFPGGLSWMGSFSYLIWKEKEGTNMQASLLWPDLPPPPAISCSISPEQFLPHAGDRILITGAADSKVHVHDLTVKETIHMFGDHTNRVKRIATAPMWPNTFWSAAEDGLIR